MFSVTKAIQVNSVETDNKFILDTLLKNFLETQDFKSGFICLWSETDESPQLLSSVGFNSTPFFSTKKKSIGDFIKLCLNQHPTPHCHKVKGTTLWNDISSITSTSDWHPRAIFLPGIVKSTKLILISFIDLSQKPEITTALLDDCADLFRNIELVICATDLSERLRIMEMFVREVGHDIASSVQAVIAKTSLIRREIVKGKAIIIRAGEIEDEILSIYRVAENLGITVDPDYHLQAVGEFDVTDIPNNAIDQCRSEAAERHIRLKKDYKIFDGIMCGEKKALQNALMHYLLNAIKYAKSSTYITIGIEEDNSSVTFTVSNVGEIISEEEKIKIWDFGWRGKRAKELHVNGSGIGLFTVKKIITAHNGIVGLFTSSQNSDVFEYTRFSFKIPKDLTQKLSLINRTN